MAHTQTMNADAYIVPTPEGRLASLHPLAARALEELLVFYAVNKISADELGDSHSIGFLELAHPWVMRGNALEFLDTYEKYLTALGELVQVFGGKLSDMLIPEKPRERTFFEMLFAKSAAEHPARTLHETVQRETYMEVRRRRLADDVLN